MSSTSGICKAALLVLGGAVLLPAQGFLPLKNGNTWTYRQVNGTDTFTVRVGLPAVIGGRVYHRLIGYVQQHLWVRLSDDGSLVYRDEEGERDVLLTAFRKEKGRFDAPFRECPQDGEADERAQKFEGPLGQFDNAVRVNYQVRGCADAGVLEETFLDNIGMVERKVTTIAGPRAYELIRADTGLINFVNSAYTSFRVEVPNPVLDGSSVTVTMRLTPSGTGPLRLLHVASQDFDIVVRNSRGEVMYRYSDHHVFLPAVRERIVDHEAVYDAAVPLTDRSGAPWPKGEYRVEAWLTAGESGRDFAAVANFQYLRQE